MSNCENNNHKIEAIAPPALHEKVLQLALKLPAKNFLDTPAGYGAMTEKLLASGKDVVAGDIDISKFKLDRSKPNLKVVRLDLNDAALPLDDNSFDAVISIEGIEHLQNQWCFVRNIHRVLKPGGSVILTTPNILNFSSRLRFLMEGRYEHFKRPLVKNRSWIRDIEQYHISPVSFFELQFMLESCGFLIETIHTNKFRTRNLFTRMLKPLFKFFYINKNYRDRKRGRGEHRSLYETVMSDVVFFGECLIITAKKMKASNLNFQATG